MAATTTRARVAPTRRRKNRRRTRITRGLAGSYVMVLLYALTLAIPLYWLVISAFKPTNDIVTRPFTPTFASGFSHFTHVWELLDMGAAMISSIYITTASLILTLVVAVPAAYAIARTQGKAAVIIERVFALGFLIPGFAALIPTLLLAIKMGMFYEREFMILYLPATAQPLAVILLAQFMRTVPASLEESARIDGAGRFRILWSVYLPLVMPGIATISILNFISFWNEYLYTLIIVGVEPNLRTVQVALPTLQGNHGITDYSLICAGAVMSVAPIFVVYAVLNRRMENALVQGALKG